jgi:hypothetical protein
MSCNDDSFDESNRSENKFDDKMQLVSPKGFKIANDYEQLKLFGNLRSTQQLLSITYYETNELCFATVFYDNDGILQNFVISNRPWINQADKKKDSLDKNFINDDDRWIWECTGCNGCIIDAVVYPDGTVINTCSVECCSLRITKTTSLEP